ncbi:FtsX-like permease family protein [Streptomyces sp. NPDC059740]|uniref:FtsX-like permease family protein n=1 Tax=Streptomyces sp. NPDC059740 TaxID=3346926 RepID=UPI00365454A9
MRGQGGEPGRSGALRRWGRDLLMGCRFAFSGRQGQVRTLLTAVGVGLGVAMLLLAASVPHMLSERQARTDASGGLLSADEPDPTAHSILVADAGTSYHGKSIEGTSLKAEGSHPVVPPGVDRFPKPGQMVVSPALRVLLDSGEGAELRKRFHSRVVGTIGPQGLSGPKDLSLYIGSDQLTPHTLNVHRMAAFGGTQERAPVSPMLILLGAVACVVLLMPVAVFIGTAARFGGERRDQRLAALRLVGADGPMVRRVAAGESLGGALLGLVIGSVLFVLARQLVGQFELFGISAFPSDVVPQAALGLLVVVGIPAVAVAVSVFALRKVAIEPLGVLREAAGRRRRVVWRLLPPALGLALLLPLAGSLGGGGSVNEYQVVAAVVLLLSGVALLLPWLVERLVGMVHGGAVSWQLAVRRLQLSSGTASRSVSGITVAVAGAIALQMLLAAIGAQQTQSTVLTRAQERQVSVSAALASPTTADHLTRALTATPGVAAARGYVEAFPDVKGGEDTARVVVASCGTLRQLADIGSCRDGQVFRSTAPSSTGSEAPPSPGAQLLVAGAHGEGQATWRVPTGTATVRAAREFWGDGYEEAILATPAALAADRLEAGYTAFIQLRHNDSGTLERVRTAIYRDAPAASVLQMQETKVSDQFAGVRKAIFAAAVGVLLLIGASMVVTQAEQLRERRRQLAVLVAFGTRRATLGASVLWQAAVPVVLGLVLASVFGMGLGWALLRLLDEGVTDWFAFWPMTAVGAVLIALVTLTSLPLLWRLMRAEGLQSE